MYNLGRMQIERFRELQSPLGIDGEEFHDDPDEGQGSLRRQEFRERIVYIERSSYY